MAVAEKDPFIFQKKQLFGRFGRAVVAVAGDLMERNLGKTVIQYFCIPPAIAQMKNHAWIFSGYGAGHIGDVSVRVGKNQNFHKRTLSEGVGIVYGRNEILAIRNKN